jgi:hypothetical protein
MTVEMNRDLAAITRKLGEIKYLSAKIKQSPTDGAVASAPSSRRSALRQTPRTTSFRPERFARRSRKRA